MIIYYAHLVLLIIFAALSCTCDLCGAAYSTGFKPTIHHNGDGSSTNSFYSSEGIYRCDEQLENISAVRCSNIERILIQRSHILARVANGDGFQDSKAFRSGEEGKKAEKCSTDRYLIITEIPFGNSGNNMIQFTHGLWVAEIFNSTLIVPSWIHNIFMPFNTNLLENNFCFTLQDVNKENKTIIEVTSEEAFFLHQLYKIRLDLVPFLPPWNHVTILSLSKLFLRVYAAFWATPKHKISVASLHLISQKLGNNYRYASIHKRALDGGCSKLLGSMLPYWQLSPLEIPWNHSEWEGNMAAHHPICDMSDSFTEAVLVHNKRLSPSPTTSTRYNDRNLNVFVAFDGNGDVSGYRQRGAVLSDALHDLNFTHHLIHKQDFKFIDMFISIHSEFFILNPRSTFSWQIYVIRAILGLESVPILENFDLFVKTYSKDDLMNCKFNNITLSKPNADYHSYWVSFLSIIDAAKYLNIN